MNIIEACYDPQLFRPFFKELSTWRAWLILLKAFYGQPPAPGDLALFRKHTGRTTWPDRPAKELWIICGRRSGKSFTAALLALYEACFKKHRLAVGEQGHVLICSPTRYQARIIKGYLSGFINENQMLRSMILSETAWEIELDNHIIISVFSSDFRSIRGYTAVAAVVDELAFLASAGASPDFETLRAIRPALATSGGPLICLSTPYSRAGALYETHKQHYGRDGEILVWQAASREMNPTLSQKTIEKAMQADPDGARAEWYGEFRNDVSSYATREAVEACVVPGRYELPPVPGVRYYAFVDPSGGSKDSMTLAVAHSEQGKKAVLDLVRERKPPFSPEAVVQEFCATLKTYRIGRVVGDRYGGEWCREPFRKEGIHYNVSSATKSDIYAGFLPLINSGRVELLENQRLINQLLHLERRISRGGKDSVDHGPGGHDDVINAAAGALVGTSQRQ